ncbi:phage tail assembly protein T, partial [Cupriavidus pauculus]|uniref:phage tail assembly protein T n=1 Tax=Cupriavidus pauculus TaxID=82633 RepID=UPI003F73DAB0
MDAAEFNEWMAFYRLEPWGSHYDDLRAGVVASMIGNVHRDRQKQATPFGDL